MRKITLLSCIMCASVGLMAQTEHDDIWAVYDVASKQETVVDLANTSSDDQIAASIIGEDDREEITGRANSYEKAVVVLEQKFRNERALCSGSMVAPNVVLTAAHCVTNGREIASEVDVFAVGVSNGKNEGNPPSQRPNPKKKPSPKSDIDKILAQLNNKSDTGPSAQDLIDRLRNATQSEQMAAAGNQPLRAGNYPSSTSSKIWVPQKWMEYTRNKKDNSVDLSKEEKYDYALVILKDNIGNKTGWLELSILSSNALKNRTIAVIGRSGDKPAKSLWVAKGQIGQVDAHYISHNADQIGGNSGGPITLYNDRSHIIALANFGAAPEHVRKGYVNGGLRINKQIIKAVNHQKNKQDQ